MHFINETHEIYYINTIYDNGGQLYAELYGEIGKPRYYIQSNPPSYIIIGDKQDNKIGYHESILIENENLLCVNFKQFELINVKEKKKIVSKEIKNFKSDTEKYSFKNSLFKLNDNSNNFYFSIFREREKNTNVKSYTYEFILVRFSLNLNTEPKDNPPDPKERNPNGEAEDIEIDIKYKHFDVQYSNSTSCFQTRKQYILCSYFKDNKP